jgi:gliding motility-associated-like protein
MTLSQQALIFLFVYVSLFSFSQTTVIPDPNFEQALIDLGIDIGPLDGSVNTNAIATVEELTINELGISNLTGIEAFTALRSLFVQDNALQTLNLSANINLERLWCFNNMLSQLDVSPNNRLLALRCENNNLNTLNISNNPLLLDLTCQNNSISTLNTSRNTALRLLNCDANNINALELSNNSGLFILSCAFNNLSALNISNARQINTLNCSDNFISTLNLSDNTELITVNCSNNQLCALNIRNGANNNLNALNFEGNDALNCVVVDLPNVNRVGWFPRNFSGYVENQNACETQIPVDRLDDVLGSSFTLPVLSNGSYFTAPNGNGDMLQAGDVITTNQIIYIYNFDMCFSNESNFSVIISNVAFFIPRFFTPNNDGINDNWQIIDPENRVNNISIYNRYGKLLKFLSNTTQSWNGTFKNKNLPSDSYWYEIVLNNREVLRGYFALKR